MRNSMKCALRTLIILLLVSLWVEGCTFSTGSNPATQSVPASAAPKETPSPTLEPPFRGLIAFDSFETGTWKINTIRADGSEKTQLVSDTLDEGTFGYSPDGKMIAFESSRDGNGEIYRMNVNGGELVRLTNRKQNDWGPVWSPDGQKILFYSDLGNYNWDILVMAVDGSNQINITKNKKFNTGANWSPDSTHIAYKSSTFSTSLDSPDDDALYIVRADGIGRQQLPSPGDYTMPDRPVWSPDGTKLAFSYTQVKKEEKTENGESTLSTNTFVSVGIINADGSKFLQLHEEPYTLNPYSPSDFADPVWSPDGSQLAFISKLDGYTEIYLINVDGSNLLRLTNSEIDHKGNIAWSPDSSHILFTSQDNNKLSRLFDVYVVRADGTQTTHIIGPIKIPHPVWVPE